MMKRLLVLSALLLTACSPSASFIPYQDELPDAVVGTPYFQKVDIFGGRVIANNKSIPGTVEPDNNGLYIEHCRLPGYVITPKITMFFDANCVEVKGAPLRPGTVKVTLHGGLYGNMFVSPGDYEKTYLINIVADQK